MTTPNDDRSQYLDASPFSRHVIESALNAGKLYATMRNGRFWQCRRNGKTKLWKTRPDHFSIPFKVGLKSTGRIEHDNLSHFRIRQG